jgi:hypothetical protein
MRVHYVNHLRSVPLASTKVQFTRVQSPKDIYTLFYGTVTTNLSKSLLTITGHILKLWRSNKGGWSSSLVGWTDGYVVNCHKRSHFWTQADFLGQQNNYQQLQKVLYCIV